jgi:hypothetical protein
VLETYKGEHVFRKRRIDRPGHFLIPKIIKVSPATSTAAATTASPLALGHPWQQDEENQGRLPEAVGAGE